MPYYDDEGYDDETCNEIQSGCWNLQEENRDLRKQIDWLAKVLVRYADACPRDIFMLDDREMTIPQIDICDFEWPADEYFDCPVDNPEECWKEAARRAVEEEDDAE